MARMTLLEIVSEILSDMTSDPVNSISDTFESQQIAQIVKRTYYNLFAERAWPHTGQLFRLTASADSNRPTHMLIEDDVQSVSWVKYNCMEYGDEKSDWKTISYLSPEDFINYVMARDNSEDNVTTVIDYRGTPLFILNDCAPTYWTTFDDEHLVFDSFDSDIDTTLMNSKTQVFGLVEPEWSMVDNFVPNMPSKMFSLLVNEAKSASFIKLKEVFSQKDEQAATRQRGWLSREKRRSNPGTRYPDYGRKPPAGSPKRRGNNYTG